MKQLLVGIAIGAVGTAAILWNTAAQWNSSSAPSVMAFSEQENSNEKNEPNRFIRWSNVESQTAFAENPRRGAHLKPATPPKDKLLRIEHRKLLKTIEQSAIENVCFGSIVSANENSLVGYTLRINLTSEARSEIASLLAAYDQEAISLRLYDWEIAEVKVDGSVLDHYKATFEPNGYSSDLWITGTEATLEDVLIMARMVSGDKIPGSCLPDADPDVNPFFDVNTIPYFQETVDRFWSDVLAKK